MDGAVELLKELLTIRSVNGRDDEGAVAEYLCKYFEQSGISAHIQRIDATHANVLAELEGESDDAPIFWNGHLDTVPYGDTGEWKTDPAVPVERDGFLYGRGASDMKSGLAAMVYALCEYKKSGRPVPHTIHFLGTCDEEKGGIGAQGDLKGSPGDVDWNASDRRTDGMQAGRGAERLPVAGDRSTRKDEPRGIPAGGLQCRGTGDGADR